MATEIEARATASKMAELERDLRKEQRRVEEVRILSLIRLLRLFSTASV